MTISDVINHLSLKRCGYQLTIMLQKHTTNNIWKHKGKICQKLVNMKPYMAESWRFILAFYDATKHFNAEAFCQNNHLTSHYTLQMFFFCFFLIVCPPPTCWIPAAVRIHIRSQLITDEELKMHWIQNWSRVKRSSRRCAQVCYILVPLPSSPPASACVPGLRADSLLRSPAWRKVWKDEPRILLTGDGFSSLLTPLDFYSSSAHWRSRWLVGVSESQRNTRGLKSLFESLHLRLKSI